MTNMNIVWGQSSSIKQQEVTLYNLCPLVTTSLGMYDSNAFCPYIESVKVLSVEKETRVLGKKKSILRLFWNQRYICDDTLQ